MKIAFVVSLDWLCVLCYRCGGLDGTDYGVEGFVLLFPNHEEVWELRSTQCFRSARYRQVIEERPLFLLFLLVADFFFTSMDNVSRRHSRAADICIEIMARLAFWRNYNGLVGEDRQFATSLIVLG